MKDQDKTGLSFLKELKEIKIEMGKNSEHTNQYDFKRKNVIKGYTLIAWCSSMYVVFLLYALKDKGNLSKKYKIRKYKLEAPQASWNLH